MSDRSGSSLRGLSQPNCYRYGRARLVILGCLVLVGLAVPTGIWLSQCHSEPAAPPPDSANSSANNSAVPLLGPDAPTVGGVPLFSTWPAGETPLATIVLTGQTWGYMRPCGCSADQKGGLERRANLIKMLKSKGWPVTALDLGDVAPAKSGVHDQNMLKYKYTMESLRAMGYAAVGIGEYDFNQQLFELLGQYSYQKPSEPPVILAANLVMVDENNNVTSREKTFQHPESNRPVVEAYEVVKVGESHVGVTSVVGKDMYEKLKKIDPNFGFLDNPAVLQQALAGMAKHEPAADIRVLLYQGSKDDAIKVAGAFPSFNIILCQSQAAEAEPPQFPTVLNDGKTILVQVGHKGMSVGVVGIFKTASDYDFKYQLVPLTESFVTPDEDVEGHKVIAYLEQFAQDVHKQNLLAKFTERPQPHPAQIQYPDAKLAYVGSEKCAMCHAQEYKVWKDSKHSHAMEALEKYAKRPSLRQFDGECVVCHTVGFGIQTGYKNDQDTHHLRHVGCESCHGPGSGHAKNPVDKTFLALMSPWKSEPSDRLPPVEALKKLAEAKPGEPAPVGITPQQQRVMTAVSTTCMKCHDPENDPKFDLNKYMPKIWHSGFKLGGASGLPGGQ